MNTASDLELVASLNHGDAHAFSDLMTRHGAAVYRYAWALADEPQQADDLLQDTFLVLWKRRRTVKLAGESLLPWLVTTCRYTAYNANRRSRSSRTISLDEVELAHTDVPVDELRWVHDEIAALGDMDRQLVERCLLAGESYVAAAAALGLTPEAARKRIQRTRGRLAAARAENQ